MKTNVATHLFYFRFKRYCEIKIFDFLCGQRNKFSMNKKILGFVLAFCLGLICWEMISQISSIFLETNRKEISKNHPELLKTFPQTSESQDVSESTQNNSNQINEVEEKEIWVPSDIEECLSKVNVEEPIKVASYFQPFYLRANFDGNNSIDYAVLIQGQTAKQEGKSRK